MRLPAFISRMVGFADKVESQLTKTATELATATARILQLEQENAGHVKTIGERDATIKDLNAKVTTGTEKITALEGQVTELNGKVTMEKGRANATLAAQGLHPEDVPAAEVAQKPGAAAAGIMQQYEAIKEPLARAQFYAKHKADIDKAFYAGIREGAKQ